MLPIVATLAGVLALIPQIKELLDQDNFDKYSGTTVVLTALSTLLWLIEDWMSGSARIVLLGLIVGLMIQVYILYGIVSTRGTLAPVASQKESIASLSGYTI